MKGEAQLMRMALTRKRGRFGTLQGRLFRPSSASPNVSAVARAGSRRSIRGYYCSSATTSSIEPVIFPPRFFRASSTFTASTSITAEPPFQSVSSIFRQQVALGNLQVDPAQESVVKRLARLQKALGNYDNEILFAPPPSPPDEEERTEKDSSSLHSSEEISSPIPAPPPKLKIPRGLYIHGPVGTGKSMLMDLFYQHAPIPPSKKSRFHFHSFLAHVHAQIHALKQHDLQEKGRNFSIDLSKTNNPIHRVGLQIAKSTSLLCLDEFQVTDIADAVILSQFFGVLFAKGTVIVTTSNRPPSDLYEGGLNRSYFLPFLDLLQKHCIVHAIPSQLDYRRILASGISWFGRQDDMDMLFEQKVLRTLLLAGDDSSDTTEKSIMTPRSLELQVGFQRTLKIAESYDEVSLPSSSPSTTIRVCRVDFFALCDADVGALDYRALAEHYTIVFLANVPLMDLEGHNRARRFITLVDELYEAQCCLILGTDITTAAATSDIDTPMDLFQKHSSSDNDEQGEELQTELGIDVATTQGGIAVGSLASVRELAFAFERASSRIVEMTSGSWWNQQLAGRHEPNNAKNKSTC